MAEPKLPGLAAAGLCLALAACTAIPLSTIARFSGFDEKDFAAVDPQELRVRVAVPPGYVWDAGAAKLQARVEAAGRSRAETFELAKVSEDRSTRSPGILSSNVPVLVTTLRLADASFDRLRELQRFVAAAQTERIELDVSFSLRSAPAGATSVKVWIDVMLTPREGYFTLIEGGTIRLNQTEAFGAPRR